VSIRSPWARPYEEILRFRHIAEVLLRNGLGFLVDRLGLSRFVPRYRRRKLETRGETLRLSLPARVRHTIEELGPTYIKLGQLLSTRPDLLPLEYIEELSKLLDAAPPIPAEEIIPVIEEDLGSSIDELFATFDRVPIASASIGQVHRATLPNGEKVVVKVRRPGVERIIEADLDLLKRQVRFLEKRSAFLRANQVSDLLEEFSWALRDELDYTREGHNADRLRENGHNADRLRENLADDPRVIIPRVYWNLTTRRVITLEELDGIKLTELERLREEGHDLSAIARLVVEIYLKQVFIDGFFHADPHPANILICDERVAFVDFGNVGLLTDAMKRNLGQLLWHLVNQDVDGMLSTVMRMGALDQHSDIDGLRREATRLFKRFYNVPLESISVGDYLAEMLGAAFRHRIRLPAALALLARTVIVLEGVARQIDPKFVLTEVAQPFLKEIIRERFSPRRMALGALSTLQELEELSRILPGRLDRLSSQLERGEATLSIDVRHLGGVLQKLDRIANRLAFSIIVAALIVSSALLILGGAEAAVLRIPFLKIGLPFAQIGFIIAGLAGTWLLLSVIRSRGL